MPQVLERPGRGLLVPTLFALLSLALLVQFGNWQMRRLAWKEALIERAQTRIRQPPTELPHRAQWAALLPEDYEYRPVRLTGRFLHEAEMHVYTVLGEPKGRFGGPGYWVVTPLALAAGGLVLVNRGFVPLDRKDPATRPEGQLQGRVSLEGLMRSPQLRNPFTPDDDPARNIWFTRDPGRMSAAQGLGDAAPFTLDALASAVPGGLPQGGETRLSFPNRHREYAFTWYGLGLALVLVYAGLVWRRLRPQRGERPDGGREEL